MRRCIEANGDEFFIELAMALGKAWGNAEKEEVISAEEKKAVSMDFHLMVGRHEA